jgi:carbon starvation protein
VTATLLTLAGPAVVVALPPAMVGGQPIPVWRAFWNLFGTSNQLLAALALLGVTVWLGRRGRSVWYTLGPTLFMLAMTMWSLVITVQVHLGRLAAGTAVTVHHVEFAVVMLLAGMALWLVGEALLLARTPRPPDALAPQPGPA